MNTNKKDIELSVILPAYNVEEYVSESIESILNQTGVSYEVIVVNDGSKDSTLQVLNQVFGNEDRVRIINQENQGSGYARNNGLLHAKGDYVYFMDPDDKIKSGMFLQIFSTIRSTEYNPDIVLFYFDRIDENGKPLLSSKEDNIKSSKNLVGNEEIMQNLEQIYFDSLFFPPWTKLIKREFLINNNLKFTNQKTGQDALFSISLMPLAETLLWLPQSYYLYRVGREGSAQSKKNFLMASDDVNILEKLEKLFSARQVPGCDRITGDFIVSRSFKELRNLPYDGTNYKNFKDQLKKSVFNDKLCKVRRSSITLKNKVVLFIRKNTWFSYFYFLYRNRSQDQK